MGVDMPRCKRCGHWIAPAWIDWVVLAVALVLCAAFTLAACANRTVTIAPDGTINATVSAFGYCPESEALRIVDGKRSVELGADSSGVGGVVTGLGAQAVEVLKP